MKNFEQQKIMTICGVRVGRSNRGPQRARGVSGGGVTGAGVFRGINRKLRKNISAWPMIPRNGHLPYSNVTSTLQQVLVIRTSS